VLLCPPRDATVLKCSPFFYVVAQTRACWSEASMCAWGRKLGAESKNCRHKSKNKEFSLKIKKLMDNFFNI
jgi:hypothetical protein